MTKFPQNESIAEHFFFVITGSNNPLRISIFYIPAAVLIKLTQALIFVCVCVGLTLARNGIRIKLYREVTVRKQNGLHI